MSDTQTSTFIARLSREDRDFLNQEAYELLCETFQDTRRLVQPTIAETVTHLFEELRQRRREAVHCACGVCSNAPRSAGGAHLI